MRPVRRLPVFPWRGEDILHMSGLKIQIIVKILPVTQHTSHCLGGGNELKCILTADVHKKHMRVVIVIFLYSIFERCFCNIIE